MRRKKEVRSSIEGKEENRRLRQIIQVDIETDLGRLIGAEETPSRVENVLGIGATTTSYQQRRRRCDDQLPSSSGKGVKPRAK
ncbi:unnamed protein product [Linum trigynum]|uniref:Uncharacterized protein n=1 Tax=Linum trigynum TaxID=586398 RepID=A0AAV2GCX9_9ROSI